MTTATATAPRKATAAERKAVQATAIAKLVAAYREAHKQLTGNEASVTEALNILDAAKLERSNARVLTARAAYRLATAPGIAAKDGSANQSGAAKALGVNRTTLRHHILAGEALAKKEMILRTAKPQQDERDVVEASHDKTSRLEAKEARDRKAAREAQKLEAVATAAATGDVQAMAELMPGKSGDVVTVQAAESTTATTDDTAPVPAESTAVTVAEILAKLDTVLAMVTGFTKQAAMTDSQRDAIETRLSGIATASYVEAE